MDKEEFKARIEALERLNSTLLRMIKEEANKERKMPRKRSGYVLKTAEERWERVFYNQGDFAHPDVRSSQPVQCWKLTYETPYSVKFENFEDVRTAILSDLDRYEIPEPLDEPVPYYRNDELEAALYDHPIFRILLKRQAEGFWNVIIYSVRFLFLSGSEEEVIQRIREVNKLKEEFNADSEDCNESEDEFEVSIMEDDEGGFLAYYPDLPGCITSGETLEEALANAKDAKKAWFEAREKE